MFIFLLNLCINKNFAGIPFLQSLSAKIKHDKTVLILLYRKQHVISIYSFQSFSPQSNIKKTKHTPISYLLLLGDRLGLLLSCLFLLYSRGGDLDLDLLLSFLSRGGDSSSESILLSFFVVSVLLLYGDLDLDFFLLLLLSLVSESEWWWLSSSVSLWEEERCFFFFLSFFERFFDSFLAFFAAFRSSFSLFRFTCFVLVVV